MLQMIQMSVTLLFVGVDEEQSLQKKGGHTRRIARSHLNAAVRIKEREDQLRRTTRDLRTRVREFTEVAVGIFERSLWTVTDLSFLCNTFLCNTFTAIVDLSRFNNSCLKSPASTLVDPTFQSRALRSFSLNQLRNLSL